MAKGILGLQQSFPGRQLQPELQFKNLKYSNHCTLYMSILNIMQPFVLKKLGQSEG